jgi:hypothetical protein
MEDDDWRQQQELQEYLEWMETYGATNGNAKDRPSETARTFSAASDKHASEAIQKGFAEE